MCVQPGTYRTTNDIDEYFLSEIDDTGQNFINLQQRRELIAQQTQTQFENGQNRKKRNNESDK